MFGVRDNLKGHARGEPVEPRAADARPSTGSGRAIQEAYDLWADTYPSVAHNPLMRLEQEIVESILMTLRPRRALDVGTGSGRYLPVLARTDAARVVGADFSMAMLRRVAEPAMGSDPSIIASPGKSAMGSDPGAFPLVCADARRLPFARRSFDLVNASLTVGDVVDLQAWTTEMARVLGRGGHLVYSDFHPSWTHHGWKRTFRDRHGETHELAFAAHSIEDHLAALDAAGLHPSAIREPRFRDDSDPAVKAFRRRWRNPPVVVVFHAVKQP
jgi:malonyl-CoA O-methyltransferase